MLIDSVENLDYLFSLLVKKYNKTANILHTIILKACRRREFGAVD